MRLTIVVSAVFLLAAAVLTACNSTDKYSSSLPTATASPSASAPNDGVRRFTTSELRDLLDKHQAFVVDVRNQASYDAGHIPGSKLIPSTEILAHVNELPRDKTIVTYCS